MRSTGKRYSDDFKKMVIELYNSGKPVLELCSEYGITNPTLYKWLKNPPGNESKKPIIKVDNKPKDVNKDKELLKLQKENERIKEENEILKKAIAMFAKE
ncbi:transposase [Clostridium beijerinckii]|uniref:Transposase n=1 Tax=Clostridium diolis TaxID=223919 RepID=A0AAV3VXN6_9CLOT|nr:transposase [Clostridium beijerinckii]NRT77819.1 transposase [Clostridium beijerinckii]OOM35567.1 transposase [Clostridium beijerinckii]GEA29514.1 transposase [Clostridium diolis]